MDFKKMDFQKGPSKKRGLQINWQKSWPKHLPDLKTISEALTQGIHKSLPWFNDHLMLSVDLGIEALLPSPNWTSEQTRKIVATRVVSHRGETHGRYLENSLQSFAEARKLGAWALEMDLRWTRDFEPILHHDSDLERLHKYPHQIDQLTLKELQHLVPRVPHLTQVLTEFKDVHLMIEIKSLPPGSLREHLIRLAELLESSSYNLMSLDAKTLIQIDRAEVFPSEKLLPIAQWNVEQMSELALSRKFAGLTGHYLLLSQATIDRHHAHGQKVGTGFVDTPKKLLREVSRGVDWYFSNNIKGLL